MKLLLSESCRFILKLFSQSLQINISGFSQLVWGNYVRDFPSFKKVFSVDARIIIERGFIQLWLKQLIRIHPLFCKDSSQNSLLPFFYLIGPNFPLKMTL